MLERERERENIEFYQKKEERILNVVDPLTVHKERNTLFIYSSLTLRDNNLLCLYVVGSGQWAPHVFCLFMKIWFIYNFYELGLIE